MEQKEIITEFLGKLIELVRKSKYVTLDRAEFSRDVQPLDHGAGGEFQQYIDTGICRIRLELTYQETSPHRLGDRIPDSQSGD